MAASVPYRALDGESHQPAFAVPGHVSSDAQSADLAFEKTSDELFWKITKWSCGLLLAEYTFVPISYFLGAAGCVKCAQAIQMAFLILSMRTQWQLYEEVKSCWVDKERHTRSEGVFQRLSEPLREISGIPIARLNRCGISEVKYLLFSLCPNFLNILSTAVFVGGSTREVASVTDAQHNFFNMWDWVPGVGHAIGNTPLPQLLTYLLLWTCFVHCGSLIFLVCQKAYGGSGELVLINVCDSANMLFIGKVLARRQTADAGHVAEAHVGRFFVTFTTKVFLLWGKISLMSLIVEGLSFWPTVAAWQAIFLSFYAIVPLVLDYCKMLVSFYNAESYGMFALSLLLLPFVFIALVVLPIHVAGIFYCPHHDYSLLRIQCT